MDFDVTANSTGKTGDGLFTHSTTEQFEEAMVTIRESLAQWNNFLSDEPLYIVIKKVANNAETLGIQTSEKVNMRTLLI